MLSEHSLVFVNSLLDYKDVISLSQINRTYRDIMKKWSNAIWQQQCYNHKYINSRTNIPPLISWRELYQRICSMNSYQWSSMSPIMLQQIGHHLMKEEEHHKDCIELEWKLDTRNGKRNGYSSSFMLHNKILISFTLTRCNSDIILDIFMSSFDMAPWNFVDGGDVKGTIQVSFVMDNGELIQSNVIRYRFWGNAQSIFLDVGTLESSLIRHGVITDITSNTFEIKTLKCILTWN